MSDTPMKLDVESIIDEEYGDTSTQYSVKDTRTRY